jgi:hypothetical protein
MWITGKREKHNIFQFSIRNEVMVIKTYLLRYTISIPKIQGQKKLFWSKSKKVKNNFKNSISKVKSQKTKGKRQKAKRQNKKGKKSNCKTVESQQIKNVKYVKNVKNVINVNTLKKTEHTSQKV